LDGNSQPVYKSGYLLIFSFLQIIAICQLFKILHVLINCPSTLPANLVLSEELLLIIGGKNRSAINLFIVLLDCIENFLSRVWFN